MAKYKQQGAPETMEWYVQVLPSLTPSHFYDRIVIATGNDVKPFCCALKRRPLRRDG